MKRIAILSLIAVSYQLSAFGQGALTPPGPPAPTMKTLAQVEPRTPISALPATINVSGSYYVTTNLTVGGANNGITIIAENVTLDLNGFTLAGSGGSGSGVSVPGAHTRGLCIRNGTVESWGGSGVDAFNADASRLEHLNASDNGGDGIRSGVGSTVSDCVATSNGGDGIHHDANGSIRNCLATLNVGDGIEVSGNNSVTGNSCVNNGFQAGDGAGIHDTSGRNRIEGNYVALNDRGIQVDSSGSLIIRNSASHNPVSTGASNYVIAAANTIGPTNNLANIGVVTNENPWINFSF